MPCTMKLKYKMQDNCGSLCLDSHAIAIVAINAAIYYFVMELLPVFIRY